jgi:hypothetical protein
VSTVVDWHIERRLIARLATAVEERAAGR